MGFEAHLPFSGVVIVTSTSWITTQVVLYQVTVETDVEMIEVIVPKVALPKVEDVGEDLNADNWILWVKSMILFGKMKCKN